MSVYRIGSVLMACAIGATGAALAQDHLSVPLSNPAQPVTVKVHLLLGGITVTAGAAGQVVVDSSSRSHIPAADAPAGMHRIDAASNALEIEEDHNVVTIGSGRYKGDESVSVQVPPNATLSLQSISGGKIEVTGINGELEVSNINGSIALNNVSGSVVASSQNGAITVSLDKVTPGKPMSFTTLNGKIDVTLPADTKAKLRLKTDNGSVYSDFDVKMEPDAGKPVVEDSRGQGGKYRIRMDRSVYGSINGGGPEYRFETLNGSILIHKK